MSFNHQQSCHLLYLLRGGGPTMNMTPINFCIGKYYKKMEQNN